MLILFQVTCPMVVCQALDFPRVIIRSTREDRPCEIKDYECKIKQQRVYIVRPIALPYSGPFYKNLSPRTGGDVLFEFVAQREEAVEFSAFNYGFDDADYEYFQQYVYVIPHVLHNSFLSNNSHLPDRKVHENLMVPVTLVNCDVYGTKVFELMKLHGVKIVSAFGAIEKWDFAFVSKSMPVNNMWKFTNLNDTIVDTLKLKKLILFIGDGRGNLNIMFSDGFGNDTESFKDQIRNFATNFEVSKSIPPKIEEKLQRLRQSRA